MCHVVLEAQPDDGRNPDARAGRYFRRAAKRYLGDLDEVTKLLPGQPKFDLSSPVVATIAAPPLPSASAAPFTWTSERRVGLELDLKVPAGYPVRGIAVGFARFDAIVQDTSAAVVLVQA